MCGSYRARLPHSPARGTTLPAHRIFRIPGPAASPEGLARFNSAPAEVAERALLNCCGSRRWARRVALHRPYPDAASLIAAADEAAYDLTPGDLTEALARESFALPAAGPCGAYAVAHTALNAAHAAYESRFGHVFVICLDDAPPEEALDRALTGMRARLTNDPEEERVLAAEELRRLARGRITNLVHTFDYTDRVPESTESHRFAGNLLDHGPFG